MEKMKIDENVFGFTNIGDCLKAAFMYAENAEITVSIKKEILEDGRECLKVGAYMKSADEQPCDNCGCSKGLYAPFSIALLPDVELDYIFEKGMLIAIRGLTGAYYQKHVLKDRKSICIFDKDGMRVNGKLIKISDR